MDNDLDIVLRVRAADDAEAVIVRTLASVQAAAASQGRKIGESFAKSFTTSSRDAFAKEPVTPTAANVGQKGSVSGAEFATNFNKSAKVTFSRENLMDGVLAQNQKAMRQMVMEQERAFKEMTRQQDVFARAGVKAPDAVKRQLEDLRQAKVVWEQAGKGAEGYSGAMAKITSEMNILEAGNARARGSLHKFTAALASATFEITGAVYGLTALGSIVGGPALFGGSFLKSIEDAKHGMSGTISAMAQVAGVTMSYGDASAIASNAIDDLNNKAIKYNISLEAIAKTYQAILGPGMAAGMTLKEVGEIAAIGTMAVSSMGMNVTQVVQETRDLVQGGIQAASSTLATALGLKDKDIKAAKESAEGLFVFLEKRIAGYSMAALERQNTLTGALDILKIKVQRLFADERGFEQFKGFVNDISNSIATIDKQTGEMTFNPRLVAVANDYLAALRAVGSVLGTLVEVLGTVLGAATAFGVAPVAALASYYAYTKFAASGMFLLHSNIDLATLSTNKLYLAMSGLGALLAGYTFGKILYEEFEFARKGGVMFVAGTVRLLENLKYSIGEVGLALKMVKDMGFAKGFEGMSEVWDNYGKERDALKANHAAQVAIINDFYTSGMVEAERNNKAKRDTTQKENEFQLAVQRSQAEKELGIRAGLLKDKKAAESAYVQGITEATNLYAKATEGLGFSAEDEKKRAGLLESYNRSIAAAEKTRSEALKSANKPDASAMREAKDAYKAEMEQFKQLKEQLEQDVLNGNITFMEAYDTKMKDLAERLGNAAKFGKAATEKVKTTMASETTDMVKEIVKMGAEAEKANLDFARSLMLPSEVIESEFEEKFGKLRGFVEKAINYLESIPGLDKEKTQWLKSLKKTSAEIDKAEISKSLTAEAERIKEAFNKIQEAVNLRNAELDLQESQAGGGFFAKQATEAERLALAQDIATAAQERFNKSTEALANITDESSAAYKYQVRVVNEAKAAYIAAQKTQADLANQTDRTFNRGAQQAFESYVENATNYSKLGSEVWGKAMQTMEDSLVTFIKTGKFSFKGFVDYIEELLIKLAAQKFVVSIVGGFGGLLDSVTGGSSGASGAAGGLGGLLSNGMSAYNLVTGKTLATAQGTYNSYLAGQNVFGYTMPTLGAGAAANAAATGSGYVGLQATNTTGLALSAKGASGVSGTVGGYGTTATTTGTAGAAQSSWMSSLGTASLVAAPWIIGAMIDKFGGGDTFQTGVTLSGKYAQDGFSGVVGENYKTTSGWFNSGRTETYLTDLNLSVRDMIGMLTSNAERSVNTIGGSDYFTYKNTLTDEQYNTLLGQIGMQVGEKMGKVQGVGSIVTADNGIEWGQTMIDAMVPVFKTAAEMTDDEIRNNWSNLVDIKNNRFLSRDIGNEFLSGFAPEVGNISMGEMTGPTTNGIYGEDYAKQVLQGTFGGNVKARPQRLLSKDLATYDAISSSLDTIFTETVASFKRLGEDLGATNVSGVLKNYTVAVTVDNAKNIQDLMTGAATQLQEGMGKLVFPVIDEIRALTGETGTWSETFVRVSSEAAQVAKAFEVLGISLSGTNIANEILKTSNALVTAFGGIEGLQSTLTSYYDKFYTSEEKRANLVKDITAQLNAAGATLTESQVGSASIAQWRAAYEEVVRVSGAASPLAVAFLKLHGTIADMAPTAESAATATESFVTAMKKSMSESEALTSSAEKAVTSAKATLQSAYDAEKLRLETLVNTFQSILDSLRAFRNSLLLSNLSTLSPEQKYLEAKRQFEATSSLAKTGDAKAMEALESSSNTFLEASREYYASGEAYAQDFSLVLDALDSTEAIAQREFNNAQQQLSALNQMVSGLLDVKASVLSVEQAIRALMSALSNQQAVAKPEYTQDQYGLGGQWLLDNLGDLETVRKKVLELGLTYAEVLKAAQTVNKELTLEDVTNYLDGTVKYVPPTQGSSSAATTGGTTGSSGTQDYTGVRSWVEGVIASATASGDYYSGVKQIRDASIANGITSSMLDSIMGWASGSALQAAYNVGLPAFASGGYHSGGIRLVGENGPELEVTGPSRIYSASQTADMLKYGSGIDSQQLAAFNVFSDLMQRLMSKSDAPAQKTENTAPILQAGFNGVIQKLDAVEKRLERIEDDQRKAELDK